MKKLLVAICVGAVLVTACSSENEPVVTVNKPVKHHKHHAKKHASGAVNCNK